jgi:predicted kinase
LREQAVRALDAGHTVIVDAVFAKIGERNDIEEVARRLSVPFDGLWLEAPSDVLIRRVTERTGDASDATPAVVEKQLGFDISSVKWRRLDAAKPADQVVEAVRSLL